MKSIYRSDTGRQVMEKWYVHFLDRLARLGIEVEEVKVDTRHGPTNVLVAGPPDAPPVLCFHGAMATAPAALVQIPALAKHFRIYFPDTVGQPGRSDERRLDWQGDEHGYWALDVIDQLGFESVTAFGVSLGGYVILRLASVAPERVERAVLWAPGGLIKPPLLPMFGLIWHGLAYNLRPSRARLEKILERTFTDLDDDFVSFFGDSLAHVHPDRRFPNVLADGALSAWKGEALLVVNEHDTVFPAEPLLDRARAEIPRIASTMMMDGCAHMPPFKEGALDDLMETVVKFVNAE